MLTMSSLPIKMGRKGNLSAVVIFFAIVWFVTHGTGFGEDKPQSMKDFGISRENE